MCAVATFALPGLAARGAYCGGYNDAAADFDLDAVLRGIRSIRIPAAGFAAPVPDDSAAVATPTTPVASLRAPLSYDDDAAGSEDAAAATITTQNNLPKKQQQRQDPGETYDADIDATLRAMEKDPSEWPWPSAFYLWTVQAGGITLADRAHLVSWMYSLSRYYAPAPGTLHRAVSYLVLDRFLSTTYVSDSDSDSDGFTQLLLGGVAVFAAAKYEDSRATHALTADAVAWHVGGGCTRRDVVDAERVLFATLGCRLGGPTAYDFVEHFTRHQGGSTSTVRLVAHHLADVALLDYRSIRFLPSAVAASAIALAKMIVNPAAAEAWISDEVVEVTGYALEDLAECMAEIEGMRELEAEWPFCAQMTEDFVRSYGFLPC